MLVGEFLENVGKWCENRWENVGEWCENRWKNVEKKMKLFDI